MSDSELRFEYHKIVTDFYIALFELLNEKIDKHIVGMQKAVEEMKEVEQNE